MANEPAIPITRSGNANLANQMDVGAAVMTNANDPPFGAASCCGSTTTNEDDEVTGVFVRLAAGDACEPACCEKKDGPHCNDNCIKAYATLECHTTSHINPVHEQPSDGHCTTHLESAMKRYQQLLEDASCLCRAMLSYSMIHCCSSSAGYMLLPPVPESDSGHNSRSSSVHSRFRQCGPQQPYIYVDRKHSRSSINNTRPAPSPCCKQSDCEGKTANSLRTRIGPTIENMCRDKHGTSGGHCKSASTSDQYSREGKQGDSTSKQRCCSSESSEAVADHGTNHKKQECCGIMNYGSEVSSSDNHKQRAESSHDLSIANVEPFMWSRDVSHSDEHQECPGRCISECCSGRVGKSCGIGDLPQRDQLKRWRDTVDISPKSQDVEQAAGREHVLLNVQGMTCTGCENKLKRALNGVDGISNIKTSFLNARADFDIDSSVNKIEDVVKQVHTMTGFNVARVQSEHQTVDVLIGKDDARQLMLKGIKGLLDISPLDKKTATLAYDSNIIGVRHLMEKSCGGTSSLAPPRPNMALLDARLLLQIMSWKTFAATLSTLPVVILAWAPTNIDEKTVAIISLVFATLVQGIAITEFYKNAFRSLWYDQSADLDSLVVISITAAYSYSIVAFGFLIADRPLATKEFFETSTLLITLVLAGRLIATYARNRAVEAVTLRSLQETKALLISEKGHYEEVDARLLQFGDHFVVQPHTRVPTDGLILEGRSEVDESMLTGESLPVVKDPGDMLIAGTVNGDGSLTARLTRLPGKNTVTDIAELVEQANSSKPKVQDLADRVAAWFIPVVLAIAVITFCAQIAASIRVRGERPAPAVVTAITYAIAVLAVSCPCALGLAVPMVLVITGGIAARVGVIIKSTEATERSWQITDVVFDKTGTLTTPELEVTDEYHTSNDVDEVRAITLALVNGNKHPVSISLAAYLSRTTNAVAAVKDVKVIPGCGIEALVNGEVMKAGNPAWLSLVQHRVVRDLSANGKTLLCIASATSVLAIFALETTVRPEAMSVIRALRNRNIDVHLVSGDSALAVRHCAEALEISPANVRSRCSPAEKQVYVLSLSSPLCSSSCDDLTAGNSTTTSRNDDKPRKVLVVGDGTNDAIALSSAFVSVQIGSASDVVSSTASVSLLGSLEGIIYLLDVSKAAYRRVVFNFVWAALYNVFAILLAAGVFVRARIEPRWAGLGEVVSVLPVVFAAMTMLRFKKKA